MMTTDEFLDKIERPSTIAAICWGLGWVPVLMIVVALCYFDQSDEAILLVIFYILALVIYVLFVLIGIGVFSLIEALNDK